jgi:putative membrane protein
MLAVPQDPPTRESLPPGSAADPGAAAGRLHDRRAREHLANERTLLAWVRTSLALIALGFVIARFAVFSRGLTTAAATNVTSTVFGIALVSGGFAAGLVGLVRFLRVKRQIDQDDFQPDAWSLVLLVGIALAMAVALAVYLAVTS